MKINQVSYHGDKYYYTSPEFKVGLNLIEGENGYGKSTFVNLMSYALGNYVEAFDPKKEKRHMQIMNDTNNYVILNLEINSYPYILKRFFKENKIFVQTKKGENVYNIFRKQSDDYTFSDWFLSRLNIPVIEYYQGSKKAKLNSSDLFRLMYYDQKTTPSLIYKSSRVDNNYWYDSEFLRKLIFQVLMGEETIKYYKDVGEVAGLEKDLEIFKKHLEGYQKVLEELGMEKEINIETEVQMKKELNIVENKIGNYKNQYSRTNSNVVIDIQNKLAAKLNKANITISNLKSQRFLLIKEIKQNKKLIEKSHLEIQQLMKIILFDKEINLFSQTKCPFCFTEAERKEGHCVCGSSIIETDYERFYYNSDDYLRILETKKKSLETYKEAQDYVLDLLDSNDKYIDQNMMRKKKLEKEIKANDRNTTLEYDFKYIEELYSNKQEYKNKIQNLKNNQKKQQDLTNLKDEFERKKEILKNKKSLLWESERKAKSEMENAVRKFNGIFENLVIEANDEIKSAKISFENYLPIIDEGYYKEASVDVIVRLLYFLTLLKVSLADDEVAFPRYLLIDTPETLGIDEERLIQLIQQLELQVDKPYQIIMTTGLGKYPEGFEKYVRGEKLKGSNKLLKESLL